MQKIDRDRLDENTGQIECGEEIGTVFLIDKETAITVKHCLLIEKPETYAKNAVLHFSVKDEEKTVKATVKGMLLHAGLHKCLGKQSRQK